MSKRFRFPGFVLFLIPVLFSVAFVQPPPADPWTWSQFLAWMAAPGGIVVVVGIILSFAVEYVPQFNDLPAKWKRLVFFGISLIVPLAAATLGVWTDGWPATWEITFWPALQAGVLSFASGTLRQGYLPSLPGAPDPSPGEMHILGG